MEKNFISQFDIFGGEIHPGSTISHLVFESNQCLAPTENFRGNKCYLLSVAYTKTYLDHHMTIGISDTCAICVS
jgi:hypothetical protein